MTTAAELIEWLKQFPEDAIVECGVEVTQDWQTYMAHRPVNLSYCDTFDYTSDTKHPNMAGKFIIELHGD